MMQGVGRVSQLLSICVQLANESANIIHCIQTQGLKGEKWKGKDDPITVADVKAQTLIINGIRKFYPNIRIVGEEQVEFEGNLGYNFNKLNPNLIPEQYFQKQKCDNNFNINDVVVWIDPLDGTFSYIKEEYDAVTTLIGVSYKSQPLMGVISQPYSKIDKKGKFVFQPKIYFSHIGVPTIFYANGEELNQENRGKYVPYEFQFQNLPKRSLNNLIGATSKHRVNPHILQFIQNELKPAILVRNGGAGNKALQVLNQEVDYCVHLSPKVSRWDTIVPQVFLECLGGQLTDIYGEKYQYDPSLNSFYNLGGGVYTLRKDVHDFLIDKSKTLKLLQ